MLCFIQFKTAFANNGFYQIVRKNSFGLLFTVFFEKSRITEEMALHYFSLIILKYLVFSVKFRFIKKNHRV